MRVCVLGAGVIGITTAWALSERGHDVTLVDGSANGGEGTSYGNGAQLSYSYVTPFATPSLLWKLPGIVLGRDAAIRVRPPLDRDLLHWGLRFFAACRESRVRETTAAQLALAELSRVELQKILAAHDLKFDFAQSGKLVIYRDGESLKAGERQADIQRSITIQEVLSAEGCLKTEPALRLSPTRFAGGIFTPTEQVGDCASFCTQLLALLSRKNNVKLLLGAPIEDAVVRNRELCAVNTARGTIEADTFVIALGPGAANFCKSLRFRIPVYPIKGYSLTVRPPVRGPAPTRSVTDSAAKVVAAPLGNERVRVAGAADFVGYDMTVDMRRLKPIVECARELFDVNTDGDWATWCGLRPATPDSRPIIGWAPLKRVFLNVGHGALGFTLACGSARLSADIISQEPPMLDSRLFCLRRPGN